VNPEPEPRCAWCGAPARPSGGRLAVCGTCRAATTYPPPDEAELRSAYDGFYRPPSGRFSGGGDRVLRHTRGLLAGRLDRLAPPGPILDVGCGDGALLEALESTGRVAVGLEQAGHGARAGLDVREVEIVNFDERPGEWAAVVFWHALEHLREPRAAVRRARALLAPSGLLVIAVPNLASWQARWLGDRWLALDLPRHLVHLPADALVQGVRESGLEIDRVSYWRGGQVVFGWLDGVVSMLPGQPSLYDAIRQPEARAAAMSPSRRAMTVAAGAALVPVAGVLAAGEIAARAGGSVYLEARRPALNASGAVSA
jgi:SAM-dependent methyltransferase